MGLLVAALLACLVALGKGRVMRDLRNTKPGTVRSDQLQGLHFADIDDSFGRGPIGPKGQFSKAPSKKTQASPTSGSKTGAVSSDQLQGLAFPESGSSSKAKGGTSSPPAGKKRFEDDKIMSVKEYEKRTMSPEDYALKYPDTVDLSKLGKFSTDPLGKEHLSTYEGVTKHIRLDTRKTSAYKSSYNDPLWIQQWYLQDYRTTDMPVMDLNVVPVWQMGITGKGVYVAVVDDGVVHDHPDLAPNHDKDLSHDYMKGIAGSQPDPPQPSLVKGGSPDDQTHGTKCAGIIGMVPNNGVCGVGIAHGAKVVGVKIMGPPEPKAMRDYEDGKGLVHKMDLIDISSNSYGSKDNGKFTHYMSGTMKKFIDMGIKQGRGGKGTIYIVGSGNGKPQGDMCGPDAKINHMGFMAISGVDYNGKTTYFGERCSAVFAATYAEGYKGLDVSSIDVNGGCTTEFSGTSSATPLAAGIVALVLEAAKKKGKELTYRDIMHIISMGAEVAPLADNVERGGDSAWRRNGAGFWVSNDFGFGLLNAKNMVKLAETWQNVPQMQSCDITVPMKASLPVSVGKPATIEFEVKGCQVKWLEAVRLRSTVGCPYRGAVEIALTSPAGTKTYVMESRKNDNDHDIDNWFFKSIHTWGENPEGKWKIEVMAIQLDGVPDSTAQAKSFQLIAYGLTGPPPHHAKLPRTYSAFRLADGQTSHDH